MGTTSDKLTYLNTTKGKIKDVINMTGANITSETTFRNYATKLYDGYVSVLKDKNTLLDNMPKGTSTGAITDAADLPVYEDKMSKLSTQNGTPTPENPVEVKTVKGYRNLFDKNLLVNKGFNTASGAITTENSKLLINEEFITLPSGTYTISMEYVNQLWILAYDDDGNNQRNYYQEVWNTNNPFSFTVTNYHKLRFGFNRTINDTRQDITSADVKIMLSKGSIVLPYLPYGTNWIYTAVSNGTDTNYYTLPLNGNEIAGIGDYKDEYIIDKNGHCWLNKVIEKEILNSSDTWGRNTKNIDGITYSQFYKATSIKRRIGLSNNFIYDNDSGIYKQNYFYVGGGNIVFVHPVVNGEDIDTIVKWKEYLGANNNIIYLIKTPQLIDLNYTVDIELFKGINNISNSEDMDMEIKYIKDAYE